MVPALIFYLSQPALSPEFLGFTMGRNCSQWAVSLLVEFTAMYTDCSVPAENIPVYILFSRMVWLYQTDTNV